MLKLLMSMFMLISSLIGSVGMEERNNILEKFSNPHYMVVYLNGEEKTFERNSKEYAYILKVVNKKLDSAYEVPALGVALDNEVREEIKSGYWLEFAYNKTQEHNGMPFDSLLVKVDKDAGGFNIIRKYNGKYEGRCFYINLK